MRYLNKIIFINSGSVNYAEISLDGNVHFSGTQGVGKSTLLRAILFFYNANKTNLGIPKEKKRFDEYYFQTDTSYIIYEISKDSIPYCVLVYRQSGRVVYRFFNSAYKKELFIDENNAVKTWEKIRKGFGVSIHYTRVISSYETFRQIIYGDNKSLQPEFRKYALLESKQYQNIPRTIQNVLLNAKLEAQFIKETIIKSLDEEEIKINLNQYSKGHLRDFEIEFNDLKTWFRKDKNGESILEKQAKIIIKNNSKLAYLEHHKKALLQKLVSIINFVVHQKPLVEVKYQNAQDSLNKLSQQITELRKKHQEHALKLSTDINVTRNNINNAGEKQKFYQEQNIELIINRVLAKEKLETERKQLQEEKILLEGKFTQINEKYKALIHLKRNEVAEFINTKEAEKNTYTNVFYERKDDVKNTLDINLKQIENNNKDILVNIGNKITQYQTTIIKLQTEQQILNRIEFLEQYKKKIAQKKEEIKSIQKKQTERVDEIKELKNTLLGLKRDLEFEQKEFERQKEIEKDKIALKISKAEKILNEIEGKLKQQKKVLYTWLNQHYPNWEKTVGKVISEDLLWSVKDLNPQIIDTNTHTFYGLNIDLNALPQKVKTIEDYQSEKELLNDKIENLNQETLSLIPQAEKKYKNIKAKFLKKINPIKDEINKNEYENEQSEKQLSKLTFELSELQINAHKDKQETLKQLQNEIEETTVKRVLAEKDQENRKVNIEKAIKLKKLECEQKIGEIQKDLMQKKSKIDEEILQKKQAIANIIAEIKQQQNTELSEKGANTSRLTSIENSQIRIKKELDYIEKKQALVFGYNKDKRELFDNIENWKNQLSSLNQQQILLNEQQQEETDKLQEKHNQQAEILKNIEHQIKIYKQDFKALEEFKSSDIFKEIQPFFETLEPDIYSEENEESIESIIRALHQNSIKIIRILDKLKGLIINFTGNFQEHNALKFETRFYNNEDYLTFADRLKEFIDEEKITEISTRINSRFVSVIREISKETKNLTSKETEIREVIKKINSDFRAKNFVGAITNMEIKIQESSNKIMKLLLEIKEFDEESNFKTGTPNLFNTFSEEATNDIDTNNQKAVELLNLLSNDLAHYKSPTLSLSESFDLQFRIIENDNDSGWVEKIANVGSEGTDVLVKAMINILLLNVFKESASKKFKNFKLHCMMDEVGRLHPSNVKGILRFANDRNILLINSSPICYNHTDYRYSYRLKSLRNQSGSQKHITEVKKIIEVRNE